MNNRRENEEEEPQETVVATMVESPAVPVRVSREEPALVKLLQKENSMFSLLDSDDKASFSCASYRMKRTYEEYCSPFVSHSRPIPSHQNCQQHFLLPWHGPLSFCWSCQQTDESGIQELLWQSHQSSTGPESATALQFVAWAAPSNRKRNCNILPRLPDWVCPYLAERGNAPMLRWAKQKFVRTDEACYYAARFGHLECLQVAIQFEVRDWEARVCAEASKRGHLHILKWWHNNHGPWDMSVCDYAAEGGQMETLVYARTHGCPWDATTCHMAALFGHLAILKYAHEHDCPWNETTCHMAARNGHMDVLQYAHKRGCPWDASTCTEAAENGQVEALQYAYENGCDCSWVECMRLALHHEKLHILQWLYSQKEQSWDWQVLAFDVSTPPPIMQWAYENGCPSQLFPLEFVPQQAQEGNN
ncbi:ankyrin repeat protein [Seminavis robusta]|uniref:Ankyrin repeat protein n=1 Tax=Seminavis robusta TaxID=568900 RepID=A0A9N8EHG1_9STRA|nr:ankyrin repeat protein [Seminavis robusta]|eukprot:Sro1103_g241700.1 ankyrin repeat protein (419) ;mRNA; f:23928-25272